MRFYFSLILAFVISQSLFAQGTVDSYIAINEIKNENTFVLIFANENYKYEQSVPFAHNDGEVFNLYCEKTLGIPPKHIHYVADATLNDMYMQLQWLETLLKTYAGDARSIIYYSGHGMPSEDGKHSYLLPVDGNSRLHKSGLSTESLYKQLGALPSKGNIIILDACFSGTKRDGEMLSSSRGVAIKPKDEAVLGKTVVFSASSGDETAYPYKEKEHGLFTYFLLEQLQKNGGFISFGDLSDNVTRLVTRCSIVENGKPQTPTVRASASAKDWREWLFADKRAVKFETISRMSSPKRETSELNSNSEVLFTSEWLTKEVDSKMRDYVRSRFNIFGTSLSLKDAVTEHYTKIERSHGKLKTMAGFADGRTTDEASYKAQNSVANRYAVMCSTTLKGTRVDDLSN